MSSPESKDLRTGEYGGIRPGLTRAEVEAIAGSPVHPGFRRGGLTTNETVEYSGCFFVIYNLAGRAIGVEFFAGSEPEFMGVRLLGRSLHEVLEDLERAGIVPTVMDAEGCDFVAERFGLFTIDGRVEGVTLEPPRSESLPQAESASPGDRGTGGLGELAE